VLPIRYWLVGATAGRTYFNLSPAAGARQAPPFKKGPIPCCLEIGGAHVDFAGKARAVFAVCRAAAGIGLRRHCAVERQRLRNRGRFSSWKLHRSAAVSHRALAAKISRLVRQRACSIHMFAFGRAHRGVVLRPRLIERSNLGPRVKGLGLSHLAAATNKEGCTCRAAFPGSCLAREVEPMPWARRRSRRASRKIGFYRGRWVGDLQGPRRVHLAQVKWRDHADR